MIKKYIVRPLNTVVNGLWRLMLRIMMPLVLKIGSPLITWLATKTKQNLPVPNLEGDRDIEWSWVLSNLGTGPGEVLDFGCGNSILSFIAARMGYNITATDLQPIEWSYKLDNMRFIRGDILKIPLPASNYDLIMNCSSIEHVGLSGRYGSDENPEGDISVMSLLHNLVKPNGVMLLTIPVGRDAVFAPFHRVYGQERLPRLLQHWRIEKKEYWIKNDRNQWISVNEPEALGYQPTRYCYGLGCFVLRRSKSD